MQHGALPILKTPGSWEEVLSLNRDAPVARALAQHLPRQRWYRDKSRTPKSILVVDAILLAQSVRLLIVQLEFVSGESSRYLVPVAWDAREREHEPEPGITIAEVHAADARGFLTDATNRPEVSGALFQAVARGSRLSGESLEVVGLPAPGGPKTPLDPAPVVRPLGREQSNTCYLIDDRYVLKILRKVEAGESQEVEILRHLTAAQFAYAPRLLGCLELRGRAEPASSLGILQEFVNNQGDAFVLSVQAAEIFYEQATTLGRALSLPQMTILELCDVAPPPEVEAILGAFIPSLELLGRRVAELHVALAPSDEPEFRREIFDASSQRALAESIADLAEYALQGLRASHRSLPGEDGELARAVLRRKPALRSRIRTMSSPPLVGARIRVHGDLHLGQVLYTGQDFSILDFEGEPARSKAQRRAKRSPMADVAGMLRSLEYAAHVGSNSPPIGFVREAEAKLRSLAEVWQKWAGARFLRGYLRAMAGTDLLPLDQEQLQSLLEVHLLEKALYETVYELENRPAWLGIPLRALLSLSR